MTTYYVALNGNDSWSGTLAAPNGGSTDGPFRTVKQAASLQTLNPGDTIYVRNGIYQNDCMQGPYQNSMIQPLVSGSSGNPITIATYPGDRPATIQSSLTFYEPNYNPATTAILKIWAQGGTYTLTISGQTTAPIAYNASASTIQTALQGLSTGTNVIVTNLPAWDTIGYSFCCAVQNLASWSNLTINPTSLIVSPFTGSYGSVSNSLWLGDWSGPDAHGIYSIQAHLIGSDVLGRIIEMSNVSLGYSGGLVAASTNGRFFKNVRALADMQNPPLTIHGWGLFCTDAAYKTGGICTLQVATSGGVLQSATIVSDSQNNVGFRVGELLLVGSYPNPALVAAGFFGAAMVEITGVDSNGAVTSVSVVPGHGGQNLLNGGNYNCIYVYTIYFKPPANGAAYPTKWSAPAGTGPTLTYSTPNGSWSTNWQLEDLHTNLFVTTSPEENAPAAYWTIANLRFRDAATWINTAGGGLVNNIIVQNCDVQNCLLGWLGGDGSGDANQCVLAGSYMDNIGNQLANAPIYAPAITVTRATAGGLSTATLTVSHVSPDSTGIPQSVRIQLIENGNYSSPAFDVSYTLASNTTLATVIAAINAVSGYTAALWNTAYGAQALTQFIDPTTNAPINGNGNVADISGQAATNAYYLYDLAATTVLGTTVTVQWLYATDYAGWNYNDDSGGQFAAYQHMIYWQGGPSSDSTISNTYFGDSQGFNISWRVGGGDTFHDNILNNHLGSALGVGNASTNGDSIHHNVIVVNVPTAAPFANANYGCEGFNPYGTLEATSFYNNTVAVNCKLIQYVTTGLITSSVNSNVFSQKYPASQAGLGIASVHPNGVGYVETTNTYQKNVWWTADSTTNVPIAPSIWIYGLTGGAEVQPDYASFFTVVGDTTSINVDPQLDANYLVGAASPAFALGAGANFGFVTNGGTVVANSNNLNKAIKFILQDGESATLVVGVISYPVSANNGVLSIGDQVLTGFTTLLLGNVTINYTANAMNSYTLVITSFSAVFPPQIFAETIL